MMGLSARDLADLQAIDRAFMQDTATIVRPSGAMVDGVQEPGETTVAAGVACRLQVLSGDTTVTEDLIAEQGAYRLYLPLGTLVAVDDVVTLNGQARRFRVVWVPVAHAYATSTVAGMEEL